MPVTLTHVGRTPGQTQYGLDTFTERFKCNSVADVVLTDAGVPQRGDAHPAHEWMFVTDRYCTESGGSASALDVIYMGCLLPLSHDSDPTLPPQKASSSGQVASATTNTSSVIYPAVATNPASVQYYAITNTLSFISTDPADASEPDDPPDITVDQIITWDLGFGVQPQCHDDILSFLLSVGFVQGIVEPPPEIEPLVQGQYYQITKRKTKTLFPYNPAC